ncbi:hypothetical protein [Roseomonas populi]|uniref:Uncharacterized protein n=1 Tax=Roseomonas populi TaxID=3121582 RepID=A0ABT1X561_9PROT|nr:hypothetical protein [Roseomonas pecuniae]MCR0983248.1 hypothetical protein [Roseomonas pecuniae]
MFSKTLRTLALAAALVSPVVAGAARAETGAPMFGPSAYKTWNSTDAARTPLASPAANNPAQEFLLDSGATGGGGQHA